MKRRLYDDNLYKFDTPQASYWEATAGDIDVHAPALCSHESCDVAIIGGGYTGLSAALHLARDYNIDVRVLEAGHIGWGASGRNGGFCSLGGTGVGRRELVKMVGLEKARVFNRSQVDAVELVRDLGSSEGIEYQAFGNAELDVAHTKKAFEGLKRDVPPGAVAGLYDDGMHGGTGRTGAPQTTLLPGGAGSSPFGQQAQQQSQAKPPSWSSSAFDQARSLGN